MASSGCCAAGCSLLLLHLHYYATNDNCATWSTFSKLQITPVGTIFLLNRSSSLIQAIALPCNMKVKNFERNMAFMENFLAVVRTPNCLLNLQFLMQDSLFDTQQSSD